MKLCTLAFISLLVPSAYAEMNEAEPSAISWIMGAKKLTNFNEFDGRYRLEFYSYDFNQDDDDLKVWFRFNSSDDVCDVHVGSQSKLVREAKCTPR